MLNMCITSQHITAMFLVGFVRLVHVMCFCAGQRTADTILEESFRVARDVARERMGGKKSSGVSPSTISVKLRISNVFLLKNHQNVFTMILAVKKKKGIDGKNISPPFPSTGWWQQFWWREWWRRREESRRRTH